MELLPNSSIWCMYVPHPRLCLSMIYPIVLFNWTSSDLTEISRANESPQNRFNEWMPKFYGLRHPDPDTSTLYSVQEYETHHLMGTCAKDHVTLVANAPLLGKAGSSLLSITWKLDMHEQPRKIHSVAWCLHETNNRVAQETPLEFYSHHSCT